MAEVRVSKPDFLGERCIR